MGCDCEPATGRLCSGVSNTDAEPTTDGEQKLAPEEDKASPPGSPRPKRVARPNPRLSGPEWTVKFNSFWVLWVSSRKCESSGLN